MLCSLSISSIHTNIRLSGSSICKPGNNKAFNCLVVEYNADMILLTLLIMFGVAFHLCTIKTPEKCCCFSVTQWHIRGHGAVLISISIRVVSVLCIPPARLQTTGCLIIIMCLPSSLLFTEEYLPFLSCFCLR